MAVDTPDTVDMVSDGDAGSVVLTICDHLDWSDSHAHEAMLQQKINCYLRFIASGQLLERFPDAADREVVIRVLAQCEPDPAGAQFLQRMESALAERGRPFVWRLFQ